MEKLDEAIKIEITEDETEREVEPSTIYDLVIMNDKAETITDELSGELNSLIISSEQLCNIKVRMEKYPEIVLLDLVSYQGTNYFPLKVLSIVNNGERANYSASHYLLKKDRLIITTEGVLNNNVRIEFRMED
jgi:hypothetical protein